MSSSSSVVNQLQFFFLANQTYDRATDSLNFVLRNTFNSKIINVSDLMTVFYFFIKFFSSFFFQQLFKTHLIKSFFFIISFLFYFLKYRTLNFDCRSSILFSTSNLIFKNVCSQEKKNPLINQRNSGVVFKLNMDKSEVDLFFFVSSKPTNDYNLLRLKCIICLFTGNKNIGHTLVFPLARVGTHDFLYYAKEKKKRVYFLTGVWTPTLPVMTRMTRRLF